MEKAVDDLYVLPEACIAHIISLTTPRDASRLSSVSPTFASAAQSDTVWRSFLPKDILSILSRSVHPPRPKDFYFSLCDQPLLIDKGRKSFSLDRGSGKKCYMISARELSIAWGDTRWYWRWISLLEARFEDVAQLIHVCWFEIRVTIDIRILSPSTLYTAYLVFKATRHAHGFSNQAENSTVGLVGEEKFARTVVLSAERRRRRIRNLNADTSTPRGRYNDHNYPEKRGDGWMEVGQGEFSCNREQEGCSRVQEGTCICHNHRSYE